MKKTILQLILTVSSFSLYSQTPPSNNFKYLDINKVKAGILNRGDMHWDLYGGGKASYEVPKGGGVHSNFASAIWMGGYDNNNIYHGAAQTYRQAGNDFWPGPLDTTDATCNTTISNAYDKIWKISYTDINDFITNYNNGNVQNGSYTPIADIMTWPAHGNGHLSRNLAPFIDHNGDGIYNPMQGDYPDIKGDQTLYFIFNDKLYTHSQSGCSLPMDVEIHAMAYAYGCPNTTYNKPALDYTTFYNYKIINRGQNAYHDTYIGFWSDIDLGYYGDDYIGCNVQQNYGYSYNGDGFDEGVSGTNGYGSNIPAQGVAILKGPLALPGDGLDNDNDGTIDEVGEECLMNSFTYFNNSFPGVPLMMSDPSACIEYYRYMSGYWKYNDPVTCGGNAFGGNVNTKFVYSDGTDPSGICGTGWTETQAGNVPGDRRFVIGTGPFHFAPGEIKEVEYALVTSFVPAASTGTINSRQSLDTDIQLVKTWHNIVNKPNCMYNISSTAGITDFNETPSISIYPNPAKDFVIIFNPFKTNSSYTVFDILGNQILNGEINSSDSVSINISSIPQGIYFIRLSNLTGISTKKIIKE